MLISNRNKGFTLIEVLCSITIFSILFMTVLSMQLNSIKVKKYSKEIYSYTAFMEEVKNSLSLNCSYDELEKLYFKNKIYISKENIVVGRFKEKGIEELFEQDVPKEMPYLVMNVEDGKVLKVNLKLHAKLLGKEKIMECEFYKGAYKR